MSGLAHEWYKCPQPCTVPCCIYCDGGLASCVVCGAAEGQLLRYCPGYRLNEETLEACYTGNVWCFHHWHGLKQYSLGIDSDFYLKELRRVKARR